MIKVTKFFIIISILLLVSCSVAPRYSSGNQSTAPQNYATSSTVTHTNTSSIRERDHKLKGISSWYGPNFHGKQTANGEIFDQYGITAAHKTLPLGTVARVTNLDNGEWTILRINDRGPYVGDRILDCSYGAAIELGFKDLGTANVKVEIIDWGDDKRMHKYHFKDE